jgi:hypothetical protein
MIARDNFNGKDKLRKKISMLVDHPINILTISMS